MRAALGAALVAFAANSLLCRAALVDGATDPATFTFVRLGSGACVLALLIALRGRGLRGLRAGSWPGAWALLVYAASFSFAYRLVPAGVGALALFASVQLTMLAWAIREGTGPRGRQWVGVVLALGGVAVLVAPGQVAVDPRGLLLMGASGVAWGAYSLLGAKASDPVGATAGNFARATIPALVLLGIAAVTRGIRAEPSGLGLAALSGGLASGLGYVLWYAVVPRLGATRAAVVQLAVPALAALGGVALLGETATPRLVLSGLAILGGIALVLVRRERHGAFDRKPEGAPSSG